MQLLVAADDRTGATETAAELADGGDGDVSVFAWPIRASVSGVSVVDLGSRHLSPSVAAERAASVDEAAPASQRQAHKIDSTLRGNWAEELVARSRRRPVLLVPALPALGRTCVAGVVLDHGRPVHEGRANTDVRRRVLTSRPLEALLSAGAGDIEELAGFDEVAGWLDRPVGIAVADASDIERIRAIVQAWSDAEPVLLAGSSAVIGATTSDGHDRRRLPQIEGPILIACGSVHPAARAQLAFAEHHGVIVTYLADDVTARALASADAIALATEIPVGDVDEPLAVAAATLLARGVAELAAKVSLGALVVIGGDTAAAVIGDAATSVHGSIAPGTPWMTVDGFDVPVVTRSGGFGSDHALVDLLRSMRQ